MVTQKQAEYQARRAYDKEYDRKMNDPHGQGRNRDRQDSALSSAALAYQHKLKEWGFNPAECTESVRIVR